MARCVPCWRTAWQPVLPAAGVADLRWVAIYAAVERAAMIVTQLEFMGSRPTFSNNAVSPAVKAGWAWGDEVAEAVIEDRTGDGSEAGPVFTPVPPPRRFRDHRRDPTVPEQRNYAAHWGAVRAFGFRDIGKGFKRLPSVRKAGYFNGDIDEVRELGARESASRTAEQLETGIFWAYDGAFGIGARACLYDFGACDTWSGRGGACARGTGAFGRSELGGAACRDAAAPLQRRSDRTDSGRRQPHPGRVPPLPPLHGRQRGDGRRGDRGVARKGAAVCRPRWLRVGTQTRRVKLATSSPHAHACKLRTCVQYRVNFWRPTVGIRYERSRYNPDPDWLPYGVPATNSDLVDATRSPSFPAYPSGHATIGTAAFTAAKIELGVGDDFAFRFQSAEFDGEAKPACLQCGPRPEVTRSLTIGEAIQQNQDSRVFLGVHWSIDSEQGGVLGVTIGKRASQSFPNRF